MRHVVLLTLLSGILGACDDSYDDQVNTLQKHVAGNPLGSSSDYWLVKGSFGVEDRVALVFGYIDDAAACGEWADILNERYPEGRYTCRPAN